MQKKLMLIDGNSIINRAFYGIPLLTNAQGKYTNAVYGFLNILFRLLEEDEPDYLAVAFDLSTPTFRHKVFDAYKGTRKSMPEELREQIPLLKEVLKSMHIMMYEMEGYEADDVLGTLSKKAEDADILPIIVSGDRDMLQLAGERLKIRIPKTKGGKTEIEDYYAKDVLETYGVTPEEFIDVKALMGDASDNVPGVPGIGEKTAIKIIQQYHDIENAIAHSGEVKPKKASENLFEFQEQARQSKFLVKIIRDIPMELELERMEAKEFLTEEAYYLLKQLEFKSILSRFPQDRPQMPQTEENTKVLLAEEEIADFFASVLKEEEVAYSCIEEEGKFLGLAIYQEGLGGVWIDTAEGISAENVLKIGKDFFEQKTYKKIASDAKKDCNLLRRYQVELAGVIFDTALAGYILNPTRDSYFYDDIAGEFLNETYPSEEEVLGKGKSKKSFLELSLAERMQYAIRQADVSYRAKKVMEKKIKENNQEFLYYNIELPLVMVLADMERYGMKVDQEALQEYGAKLQESIDNISQEIFAEAGEEFNLNSPKQLGVILFEKMGLKGGKKTKTGYSTAADVLDKLKVEHPFVEKILYYRQLAKLKSTYVDGLLAVMDKDTHKIYSTFNQMVTATGRISSTEPNLQNIPIRLELGRQLRKVFIPSDESYCFLDADYSQIELRVLAHISRDETLINAFHQNQDIHRLTASQVFNVPFDEVTSLQRSNAKAVNFGIVYGIGAFSLSQDLNITRKEAEQYIEGYFQKYPKIKTYMDKTIADATEKGYVSTLWGRRRAMPELQSNQFMQRAFGERVAMNMPIQGSAADIIKMAMIRVHKALKEKGLASRLILQVHDELLIETKIEEKEQVAALLKENMEAAADLLVPLEVDVHEGKNWFETK
ncbi:MAG: DNA polymerase I [Epulopiscium sp.]|nr:DNA polymerase I [Candidatus Epulonipiscium sp.]